MRKSKRVEALEIELKELRCVISKIKTLLKLGSDVESYKKNYARIFFIVASENPGLPYAPFYYQQELLAEAQRGFKEALEERLKTYSNLILRAEEAGLEC